jgi:hypothetical protein
VKKTLPWQLSHASDSTAPARMPADLHDPVDMPETSDRDPPGHSTADEPPPPVLPAADAREQEATELAALRRQYSRASSRRQGQGTTSREPETLFGRFAYNTARFWSRQVSVIVPHEACRDHLGTALSHPILSVRRAAFLFQATEAAIRKAISPGS